MSALLEKLRKNSTIKDVQAVSDSQFFAPAEFIKTPIPIINLAFSAKVTGGFTSGLTVIAGPSKHFKSNLGLVLVASYLRKHEDGVCVFFDTEFGITPEYLAAMGIDTERVLHVPIEHVEQLKFEMVKQLDGLEKKDNVMFFVDSVGNLASKKEVEDALNEKSVADMTRAKALKSLFRIVTPTLRTKEVPCVVINHTYETQEMFSKTVVSGGTGIYYSANTIFIVGRSQEKDGTELAGYKFTINIEKSRAVREKLKFPFIVNFDGGIDPFSGLLDFAVDFGIVVKPNQQWYTRVLADENGEEIKDKKWRASETSTMEFWRPLLGSKEFRDYLEQRFALGQEDMIDRTTADELVEELDTFLEE